MRNLIFRKIHNILIGKPTKKRTTKLKIDQHETHAKFRVKMSKSKFYLTQPRFSVFWMNYEKWELMFDDVSFIVKV